MFYQIEAPENYPSVDQWLKDAKSDPDAGKVGMYLTHNGIVRTTAKASVRMGEKNTKPVVGMYFDYDREKAMEALEEAAHMDGIYYIRVWMAKGHLKAGDSIMYVLIGGDIRPHVVDALQALVGRLKNECVVEREEYECCPEQQ